MKKSGKCDAAVEHRQDKYLNNRLEGDHGKLKRLIRPVREFKSMKTAYATIKGFEVMRMFKKGQIRAWQQLPGIKGEMYLIEKQFGIYNQKYASRNIRFSTAKSAVSFLFHATAFQNGLFVCLMRLCYAFALCVCVVRVGLLVRGKQLFTVDGAQPGDRIPAFGSRVAVVVTGSDFVKDRRAGVLIKKRIHETNRSAKFFIQSDCQSRHQRSSGAGSTNGSIFASYSNFVTGSRVGITSYVRSTASGYAGAVG
jgi:hypothetical protein